MTAPVDDVTRAIEAVMQIAADLAEGKITPAEVEVPAVEQCRQLFSHVVDDGSELAELQASVARKAIAAGLIPVNELSEWVAVFTPDVEPEPELSWIERVLADGADDEDV